METKQNNDIVFNHWKNFYASAAGKKLPVPHPVLQPAAYAAYLKHKANGTKPFFHGVTGQLVYQDYEK